MTCIHSINISFLVSVLDSSTTFPSKGHELPYRSQNRFLATLTPLISITVLKICYKEWNGCWVAKKKKKNHLLSSFLWPWMALKALTLLISLDSFCSKHCTIPERSVILPWGLKLKTNLSAALQRVVLFQEAVGLCITLWPVSIKRLSAGGSKCIFGMSNQWLDNTHFIRRKPNL